MGLQTIECTTKNCRNIVAAHHLLAVACNSQYPTLLVWWRLLKAHQGLFAGKRHVQPALNSCHMAGAACQRHHSMQPCNQARVPLPVHTGASEIPCPRGTQQQELAHARTPSGTQLLRMCSQGSLIIRAGVQESVSCCCEHAIYCTRACHQRRSPN